MQALVKTRLASAVANITRPSEKMRWDALGQLEPAAPGAVASDHHPLTVLPRGALYEVASKNLVPNPNDLTNLQMTGVADVSYEGKAPWSEKVNVYRISAAGGQGVRIEHGYGTNTGTPLSFSSSVYVRPGSFTSIRLSASRAANATPSMTVDLVTGDYSVNSAADSGPFEVEHLPDGWLRIGLSRLRTSYPYTHFVVYMTTYAGNSDSGWASEPHRPPAGADFFLALPQYELTTRVTSPMIGQGAILGERDADLVAISNFGPWYRSTNMTFKAELAARFNPDAGEVWYLLNAQVSGTEYLRLQLNTSGSRGGQLQLKFRGPDGVQTLVSTGLHDFTPDEPHRLLVSWDDAGTVVLALDGKVFTGTYSQVPRIASAQLFRSGSLPAVHVKRSSWLREFTDAAKAHKRTR